MLKEVNTFAIHGQQKLHRDFWDILWSVGLRTFRDQLIVENIRNLLKENEFRPKIKKIKKNLNKTYTKKKKTHTK